MEQTIKNRAIRRLKIIGGQVRGLERLVEKEAYCITILYQSAAVKEALSAVEDLILENHLKTHAAEQMQSGKKERAVKEIVSIYKLARRR